MSVRGMRSRTTATTALLLCAFASSAHAATFTVDKTADDAGGGACTAAANDCSLRSAIQQVNGGSGSDDIALPAGTFAIGSGLPTLTENTKVVGAGARSTIIDGAGTATQALASNESLDVSDLTVQRLASGMFGPSGAINADSLKVARVAVLDNRSPGIISQDDMDIRDSVVARNNGPVLGGVAAGTTLLMANTTVADNVAQSFSPDTPVAYGGGVLTQCAAVIRSSTITGNGPAPGVVSLAGDNLGRLQYSGGGGPSCFDVFKVGGTIVGKPLSGASCAIPAGSSIGRNVDQDGSCGFTLTSDRSGVDPKLATLANNGGPTDTVALLEGSPAIDIGGACPATDQRGTARPLGGGCDAGAFESPFTAPAPTPVTTPAPAPVVSQSTPPDTTPAKVTLAGLGKSVKRSALNKGLKLKVTSNEPVSVDATLLVSPRVVKIARTYDLTVGTATLARGTGTRSFTLKPRKRITGKRKVLAQVRIVAIDAGGNRTVVTKAVTVS